MSGGERWPFRVAHIYIYIYIYIYICWQTRHTGSFQIPCLWSCPLLTDLKLSLSSLARYAISGQSGTDSKSSSSLYRFVRILLQINHHHSSQKYANFIHTQGATNYKMHGSDLRGGRVSITLETKSDSSLFVYFVIQFPPFIDWTSSVYARQPWLRWQWVCKQI